VAQDIAQRDVVKGEVVLLVGPPSRTASALEFDAEQLRSRVEELRAAGLSMRDAIRVTAEETAISRNTVYQAAHERPR
jgi:16S rRNA C1402 (ribose-2'-O) methylase RsmI